MLTLTDAFALAVNVQVLVFCPLLEHAPDQTPSRVLVSLTEVPAVNDADPLLPVETLMPVGEDVTRSPLRPVAVTVTVTVDGGGGGGAAAVTDIVVVRETPS
jgi:hypothetical protein